MISQEELKKVENLRRAFVGESELLAKAARLHGAELEYFGAITAPLGNYILNGRLRNELSREGIFYRKEVLRAFAYLNEDGGLERIRQSPWTCSSDGGPEFAFYPSPLPPTLQPRAGFRIFRQILTGPKGQDIILSDGIACVALTCHPFHCSNAVTRWGLTKDLVLPTRADILLWKAICRLDQEVHPLLQAVAENDGFLWIPWPAIGYDRVMPVSELFEMHMTDRRFRMLARGKKSPFYPAPYEAAGEEKKYLPVQYFVDILKLWSSQLKKKQGVGS